MFSFFVVLLLFLWVNSGLVTKENAVPWAERFILIVGESQCGKSEFCNSLFQQRIGSVGNGMGESVTEKSQVYTSKVGDIILHVMDSVGYLDTKRRYTDEELTENLEFAITMVSKRSRIDGIIIAESLVSDTSQLARNLEKLQDKFADKILQSCAVVGLKPDLSKLILEDVRLNHVKKEASKWGLPFMTWESFDDFHDKETYVSGERREKQIDELLEIIDKLEPYEMEEVAKHREFIEQNAKKLMDAAPKEYEIQNTTVLKETLEPYQEWEDYVVPERQLVGHGPREIGGIFGRRRRIYADVAVIKKRLVTRYKPKLVNETKPVKVEIPKVFEKYLKIAQKDWQKKMQQNQHVQTNFHSEL